jgi:predicted P-loop ATPase
VRCGQVDLEGLTRDRDQLWAEAVAAYKAKEQWHLTPEETGLAELEQEERMTVSEVEVDVAAYLRLREAQARTDAYAREVRLSVRDVLKDALKLDEKDPGYIERCGRLGPQVVTVMNKLGWEQDRITGKGGNRRNVYRKSLPSPKTPAQTD